MHVYASMPLFWDKYIIMQHVSSSEQVIGHAKVH